MATVAQIANNIIAGNAQNKSTVAASTAATEKSIEPYANNAAWAVISRNPQSINAPDFADQIHAELIAHFSNSTAAPMTDSQLLANMQQLDKQGPGLHGFFSSIGHAISSAFKSVKNAVVKVVHAIAKPVLIAAAVYLGQVYLLPALGVGAAAAGTAATGASFSGFAASATGIGASAASVGALSIPAWAQTVIHLIPTAVNMLNAKKQNSAMQAAAARQQAAQTQVSQTQADNIAKQYLAATPQQQQAYFNALPPDAQSQLNAAIARVTKGQIMDNSTQIAQQYLQAPVAQQTAYYNSLSAPQQQALLAAVQRVKSGNVTPMSAVSVVQSTDYAPGSSTVVPVPVVTSLTQFRQLPIPQQQAYMAALTPLQRNTVTDALMVRTTMGRGKKQFVMPVPAGSNDNAQIVQPGVMPQTPAPSILRKAMPLTPMAQARGVYSTDDPPYNPSYVPPSQQSQQASLIANMARTRSPISYAPGSSTVSPTAPPSTTQSTPTGPAYNYAPSGSGSAYIDSSGNVQVTSPPSPPATPAKSTGGGWLLALTAAAALL